MRLCCGVFDAGGHVACPGTCAANLCTSCDPPACLAHSRWCTHLTPSSASFLVRLSIRSTMARTMALTPRSFPPGQAAKRRRCSTSSRRATGLGAEQRSCDMCLCGGTQLRLQLRLGISTSVAGPHAVKLAGKRKRACAMHHEQCLLTLSSPRGCPPAFCLPACSRTAARCV